MLRLTFVVKGIGDAVAEQCTTRGIPSKLIANGKDFTTYETDYSNLERVAAWFCAHGECLPGVGYPNGTCLIYSVHDAS